MFRYPVPTGSQPHDLLIGTATDEGVRYELVARFRSWEAAINYYHQEFPGLMYRITLAKE